VSQGSESTGPVEVSVLVEEDHLASLDDVLTALARAGLQVTETLESVGVVTGSVSDPGSIEGLRQIDGVASVEVARAFQLPPPDEPVQ